MSDSTFPARVLNELVSNMLQRGTLDSVNQMEPELKPGNRVTGAVWILGIFPVGAHSGLNSTSVRLDYALRLYHPVVSGMNSDEIDPALLRAACDLMMSFTENFTLQGMAKAVDLLGMAGGSGGLSMTSGWTELDDGKYRCMTITVPVLVNDVWDQEAT